MQVCGCVMWVGGWGIRCVVGVYLCVDVACLLRFLPLAACI